MNASMYKNKYVAHALGGLDGFKYLNNEPALRNSIKEGHCFFEVDLAMTDDGHIVPVHGWSEEDCERIGMQYSPEFEHMTRELFLQQTVHDMPTMDAGALCRYMKKYKNSCWLLDLHTTTEKAPAMIKAITEELQLDDSLDKRVVIQPKSPAMFEAIESVRHFSYYQMFLKKGITIDELRDIIAFCNTNGFAAVALSVRDASDEYISIIKNAGLNILVYSLDDRKRAGKLLAAGADTICTNTLSPRGDRQAERGRLIRLARRAKRKLQTMALEAKIDAEDRSGKAFRGTEQIEKYVFRPEERKKYKKVYTDMIRSHGMEPGPKNIVDYYFDKKLDENTILISGLGGSVRGSMQYILSELNSNAEYERFTIYVRTNSNTEETVKAYIKQNGWSMTKIVNKGMASKMETCKYLVTESHFYNYGWTKKHGQILIDLWHGTPLKKLGAAKSDQCSHKLAIQQKNFLSADYLMYPNTFTRDILRDSYLVGDLLNAKGFMMGYPRTSGMLRAAEENSSDLRTQLAPNGEHIYAYMPTFREGMSDADAIAREASLLEYLDGRLRSDQILYVNLHHKIKAGLDFSGYRHIRSFPELIDSYTLLAATESLISDYSSVFFDYLALRRQIILYIEDLDSYNASRGLNLDIEKLPFDLARTPDQIIEMLERGKQYDDSAIYEEMCVADSADNPTKFCRIFNGDEGALNAAPAAGNDKHKVILYTDGCVAGSDTDRLDEIIKAGSETLEIYTGCDSEKTEANKKSAYPMLDDALVIASQDDTPMSSLGGPVLELYKNGSISFRKAMRFLHYEYALTGKRMYGDAVIDIMGIFDTTEPGLMIGLALSEAKCKMLFISERTAALLRNGDKFLTDAAVYAAAYCSHIIVSNDEDKMLMLSLVHSIDQSKLVMAASAESVIALLEKAASEV